MISTNSRSQTSDPRRARRRRALRLGCRLALSSLLVVATAAAARADQRPISVSYLSENAVYVDAGRAEGLAVGSRLRIVRGGDAVAEIEVEFVAEHSASCRVVTQVQTIRSGDTVLLLSAPVTPESAPEQPAAAPAPVEPEPQQPSPIFSRTEPQRPQFRASGYLAYGYNGLTNANGPSSNESTGRLSLRLRNIANQPIELRVRARSRTISRSGYTGSLSGNDRSDRLYELSLSYLPPGGRVHLYLGRIGYGPFLALGNVDGLLGEVRLVGGLWMGVFGGARPDLTQLGYSTAGRKYGAFVHYLHDAAESDRYAELVLGGVSEKSDTGDPSRDYVTVESRFGAGARWWLSQRAEIDYNRGWRQDVAGKGTQISNAALAAAVQLTPSLRASVSYDQRRNYLTWETRPLPEEVFIRYFRESGRVGLDWHTESGWNASLGGGTERADSGETATTSAFASLFQVRSFGLPLLLGSDVSYYTGGSAQGYVVTLRSRWAFRGGHDVGLTLGGSRSTLSEVLGSTTRTNQWARVSSNIQLPGRLWLYLEYEYDTGDDFDGSRVLSEIGYRF